jgi:hypothetical protein
MIDKEGHQKLLASGKNAVVLAIVRSELANEIKVVSRTCLVRFKLKAKA